MSGWIGVDLDGTLAMHGGGAAGAIGPPVPAMLARVQAWIADGRDVRIFTARVASVNATDLIDEAEIAIQAWCLEHVGCVLPVTAEKDYGMVECWDDRAVQVIPNTGECAQDFFTRVERQAVLNELRAVANEYGESTPLDHMESFVRGYR